MRVAALALLLLASTPAEAGWRQASSDHFVIYSEESAKSLEAFATKLEKFDRALRATRNMDDPPLSPGNRLTVFVVPSVASVQKLYGKGGGDIAGFYSGRATGSVAFTPRSEYGSDQAQLILLHEYAHHFMAQASNAAFPAWFVEGFAEFNSTARFDKDGTVGIGVPAHHRAPGLFLGSRLPLEKMLSSSVSDLKGEDREELYGRGWLLTHYLMFEPSRSGQLGTYIRAINEGKPSLDAAKAAFGDLKILERDLNRYVERPRMHYRKIAADKVKIGTIAIRDLTPAEAAIMDVRMKSKRGVDNASAKVVAELARKAAAPYPTDVLVQTTLAEAEFDAGNHAEAEAAADRALKTDPHATEALIYKGRARMAIVSAAEKKDAAAWRDVRKWFLAANKIDPEDPEPLMLFYMSFNEAGERPTANAALALARALELAPQDRSLRWMVAQQHLRDGKGPEARITLAPLAFDPHGGKGSEMASNLLALIDSKGAKDALEEWGKVVLEEDGSSGS